MTLRVKLEIVPFGIEEKSKEIGRLDIFNKGRIDFDHYSYGVIELDLERNTGVMWNEEIYHRRDLGAWVLVSKVLEKLNS